MKNMTALTDVSTAKVICCCLSMNIYFVEQQGVQTSTFFVGGLLLNRMFSG